MAEMRTTPSLSTNHTNGINTANSASPPDLNDVNGLTTYVNTIFRQMEEKFSAASEQVMNRMNELGKRIDTLETNLGDIITQLPSEPSTSTAQPVKTTKS